LVSNHRNAIPESPIDEEHRAEADLIERIMNGQNSTAELDINFSFCPRSI